MKLFLVPRCPCKFDVPLEALESGLDSTLDTPCGKVLVASSRAWLRQRLWHPEIQKLQTVQQVQGLENSWVPLCLWVLLKFGGTVKNDHLRWLMRFPTEMAQQRRQSPLARIMQRNSPHSLQLRPKSGLTYNCCWIYVDCSAKILLKFYIFPISRWLHLQV